MRQNMKNIQVSEEVKSLSDEFIELRSHFHRYPELGFKEDALPIGVVVQ